MHRCVDDALPGLAAPDANLVPALLTAVHAYATEGEIMDTLAAVFGRYTETPVI